MDTVVWVVVGVVLSLGTAVVWGRQTGVLRRGGLAYLPTSAQTSALRAHETWRRLARDLDLEVERSSPLPPKGSGTVRAMRGTVDGFELALWSEWTGRARLHVQLVVSPPLAEGLRVRTRGSSGSWPTCWLTGDAVFDAMFEVSGEPMDAVLRSLGSEQREAVGRLVALDRAITMSHDAVEVVVDGEVVELRRLHELVQAVVDVGIALRRARQGVASALDR